jgi:radical SAM modification target selenobiotic family peptide
VNLQEIHDPTHILLFPSWVFFIQECKGIPDLGRFFSVERRMIVDEKHLKKLLAGLCISGLVAGASLIPVNSSGQGSSG